MKEKDISKKPTALEIRKKIFLTGYSVNVAHLASAFSLVEILYSLYLNGHLNIDPNNLGDPDRDRLVLSKGHGSLALYVILQIMGFFDEKFLASFCKPGSVLGGEPCVPHIPGVEATTGSLGHGLSLGVGMALANKIDKKKAKTYVILGDGECEEGAVWEGFMFAAKEKLDNLVAVIDCNEIQKMGPVKDVMGIDNWRERLEDFGWDVIDVDGHDIEALDQVFEKPNKTGKPRAILAHTIKGKGVSIVENDPRWHWRLPSKRELKTFMAELNITEEEVTKCKKVM